MINNLLIWGNGRMAQKVAQCAAEQGINCICIGRTTQPEGGYDAIIDFSHPAQTQRLLRYALHLSVPLVIGTTGHNDEQLELIEGAAKDIPLCIAANFSLGVAALNSAVRLMSSALKGWQTAVIETHRTQKIDTPSGTAIALANCLNSTPQMVSLRLGDEKGTHTIVFYGEGESITITHRANDRKIFAIGALNCAQSLVGRGNGKYSVEQLTAKSS